MIEMILGSGREGKTTLAFDRAITECKDYDNCVAVFSYQSNVDWIVPQLDFGSILEDKLTCTPYQKFNIFGIDSEYSFKEIGQETYKALQTMDKAYCWPKVIVIDFDWPIESFKWISQLEQIYSDRLFIVTVKKKEYVEYLEDYNLCKLLKDKEGVK